MDYRDLTNLVKLISKSNLSEFKLKQGDIEVSMKTDKYVKHVASKEVVVQGAAIPMPSAVPSVDYSEVSNAPKPADASNVHSADEGSSVVGENQIEVKSPIVGTFYRSSSPENPPYIKVGDEINKGDIVCIVEAMKLFNEIESEVSGKVVKVLVEDNSPVEYDQPLFLVEAS